VEQITTPLFKVNMPVSAHAALKPVLESGQLAAGSKVASFESRLAYWLGAPDTVALSDATAAITLSLYLAGVRPGDEVITSPLACSATLMPIANLFATPVWCDIDPCTGMPDTSHIGGLINEKTRAILLYHWSGDVADVSGIATLAHQKGIKLIEDASEALGAEWCGRRLSGEADFTVYSFYATKHITTGGEGAALLAADQHMIQTARYLRRFGINPTNFRLPNGDLNPVFDIPIAGFNFQMNEIAATVGLEQLLHADSIVARHRANGQYYDTALAGIPGLKLLNRRDNSTSAFWTYALRAERREDLIRKLNSNGIGAQRLHMNNYAYTCFSTVARELPGLAKFDEENLSIPCGWWVGNAEREAVVDCIRKGW
jgi:dTDP-4-amino-4,6-dideoxygalactose transaminase